MNYIKGNKTAISWILLILSLFFIGLPLSLTAWLVASSAEKDGENAEVVKKASEWTTKVYLVVWVITFFFYPY